jgi:hypothetical protein
MSEFSKQDMAQLVNLIEDGELDNYFVELRAAIDDRMQRQREVVLKIVKATFGDDATVVNGGQENTGLPVRPSALDPTGSAPVIQLEDGTQVPLVPDDPDKFAVPPDLPDGATEVTGDVLDDLGGNYITTGARLGPVR